MTGKVLALLHREKNYFWVICSVCGEKLFKITKRGKPRANSEIEIECKCKAQNLVIF